MALCIFNLKPGFGGDPDALRIEAYDDAEQLSPGQAHTVYVADGWLSATTNHFDPDQYGPDGHLREGAQPRAMTSAEAEAYCLELVREQNALPGANPAPLPAPLSFPLAAPPPAPPAPPDQTTA